MDELKPEDLSFSAYPEPIAGGMHVGMPNGVLATHLPTGIKVVCNHYRSQHQNRDACLRAIASALNTRSASGGDSASLGVDSIDRCLEHPEALGYVDVAGFKRWVALNPGAVSQLIISLFNELPLDTIRPAVIARLTDAPAGNPEQLASLEQRARELLARELDAIRFPAMAAEIRDESGYNTCGAAMVRVVTAALANQQGVGGWRFSKVSGGRDGDAWEIYDDTGSGGVVSTHDVKDWLVRKLLDNLATKHAAPAVEIIGEIVRAGDDEEGQPRIVVRTTRLAIQAIAVNPIGLNVRITATQPAGDVGREG